MKKILSMIIVLIVFVSTPIFAACSEQSGTATLISNDLLDGIKIVSPGSLNGTGVNAFFNYGVSTFQVDMKSREGARYYGYSLDPGLSWNNSKNQVCCYSITDGRYTKGVKQGFVTLAKYAGSARKSTNPNPDYIAATDMAIRLYAMANNLSSPTTTGSKSGLYYMTNYLQFKYALYRQGQKNFGSDHDAINKYVNDRMAKSIYKNLNLEDFLYATNQSRQDRINAIVTQAYSLFLSAMNKKNNTDSSRFGSSSIKKDIVLKTDEESTSCRGKSISIPVEVDSSVTITKILINERESINATYLNGVLTIDTTNLLYGSYCNNGGVSISIQISYTGGQDENVYLCDALYGSEDKPRIITYVGENGMIGTQSLLKIYTTTLTLPGSCIPDDWAENCLNNQGKRCIKPDKPEDNAVKIKSSIHNCCIGAEDENTSTVTDALSSKSVDDDLDVSDLFMFNPKLSNEEILSVVKCGVRSLTAAPDFIATSSYTDKMKDYCQMYCMERTKIITPPPVTVTAGRYFELDFSKFDIEAERQCRISLDNEAFFREYLRLVGIQKNAFNAYYENISHAYLYQTVADNGFQGTHRFPHFEEELEIDCSLSSDKVYIGSGWNVMIVNINNSRWVKCEKPSTCTLSYDKLQTAGIIRTRYPIFKSQFEEDVKNKKTGEIAYGAKNTIIKLDVSNSPTSHADFKRTPSYGFFAASYQPTGCADPNKSWLEKAGSPTCVDYKGRAIAKKVTVYTDVHCCTLPTGYVEYGTGKQDCEGRNGSWASHCTKEETRTNGHSTNDKDFYSDCKLTETSQNKYDYVTGKDAGLYEDFERDMETFFGNAKKAKGSFTTAVDELLQLEKAMLDCLHFFEPTHYGGTNMSNHYDVNKIAASFEFDQIYSTSSGGMTTSTVEGFIDKSCKVDLVNVYGLFDPAALGARNYIDLQGFHNSRLKYEVGEYIDWTYDGSTTFSEYLHREANNMEEQNPELFYKYVIIDGTYKVDCNFYNTDNDYYTLVPGGNSVSNPIVDNYVSHSKLFPTYLTTYAGKHEILYHLTGLGSQVARKFDPYFQTGLTCSERNSGAYDAPASCYFEAIQKLVTTGVCENVASSSNYTDVCYVSCAGDGSCNSIYNFVFKNVEPDNIFPVEPPSLESTNGWGKNWLTSEGTRTRSLIENDGKKDLTYSTNNLTYSFVLTTKTISAIKDYNNIQYEDGGYNDFDLSCNCGNNGSQACTKCTSTFLSNLAQRNAVETINSSYIAEDNVWGNSASIQEIRNSNPNWIKDITPMKAQLS